MILKEPKGSKKDLNELIRLIRKDEQAKANNFYNSCFCQFCKKIKRSRKRIKQLKDRILKELDDNDGEWEVG